MYYIYYSGFLTSFSVVFALSFQPILLKAGSSIILFAVASFLNHGTRATFSALTSKLSQCLKIQNMIMPLYFLYIIAFLGIFIMMKYHNTGILIIMLSIICLIIGFQLMFTIRQISRLHFFVESENRGTIISINNLFSRFTTFIVLLFSKLFMDKLGFESYYLLLFFIFILAGFILSKKTSKI